MILDSAAVELDAAAGPVIAYVDPDEVAAFARALDDGDPRYQDGTLAPPTYSVTPALPVVHQLPGYPPAVAAAARAIVHGEHDMVLHRPLVPGTRIAVTAERLGVVPTKAGLAIEQVVRVVAIGGEDEPGGTDVGTDVGIGGRADGGPGAGPGELLVEHHWVALLVGDAAGPARGAVPPDHTFPEEARARPVGTVALPTTRDQTFRYAGASGDRNPMHVNDEVARQRGFPRKFNQGLLTLGLAARGLVGLVAGGDPARLRRLAVRFAAPAFPGDDVEVTAYELDGTPEGGAAYAFEAHAGGRAVLRHGRVEVRPAQDPGAGPAPGVQRRSRIVPVPSPPPQHIVTSP
ncbi:MAG TPA: MaoC/PaaZ C-terminal domain-containing protein [Acidimicrobiales bacterium]